jgi:hypothetical protein
MIKRLDANASRLHTSPQKSFLPSVGFSRHQRQAVLNSLDVCGLSSSKMISDRASTDGEVIDCTLDVVVYVLVVILGGTSTVEYEG